MIMSRFSFHPLYNIGEWLDGEAGLSQRLTISFVVSSGVNSSEIGNTIVDYGTMLKIELTWPDQLCYPEKLFKPFIDDESKPTYHTQHPEINALERSLKELRSEVGKRRSELLSSTARIRLPFPVVPNQMEKFVIPFETSDTGRSRCMVLNVRLFAVEGDYGTSKVSK